MEDEVLSGGPARAERDQKTKGGEERITLQGQLSKQRSRIEDQKDKLAQNTAELEVHRKVELELLEINEELQEILDRLRRSETRYRELAESITDLFFALDMDLRYTYWNKASERFTGIPAREALGKSIHELFFGDPDALEQAVAVYSEVLRSGMGDAFINRYERDGQEFYFEVCAYPVEEGLTVFAKDITERMRVQKELQARSEELDSYAGAVSHDLAGSMVVIGDFASAALRYCEADDVERAAEYMREIDKAVTTIREYIEGLMVYARAGYSESEGESAASDLILRAVLDDLARSIEDAGAEVRLLHGSPAVLASPAKLRQVFSNLVQNALDHARSDELVVEIGSIQVSDEVTFFVRDNGQGIPPEMHGSIFLPFKGTRDSGGPGWGMGLAIVKRAVESWGGRMWIESVPGEGCCFYFTVPAYAR
ncbi:MAG: PAS domain S-box protein [Actinobacteria bacterium]|nr:PAS domain S-box protein [Actinomycetota bacterium]